MRLFLHSRKMAVYDIKLFLKKEPYLMTSSSARRARILRNINFRTMSDNSNSGCDQLFPEKQSYTHRTYAFSLTTVLVGDQAKHGINGVKNEIPYQGKIFFFAENFENYTIQIKQGNLKISYFCLSQNGDIFKCDISLPFSR